MTIRARVRLTQEIDVADTWGGECTAAQVQRQAVEAAMGAISRGITIGGRPGDDSDPKTRGWGTVVGAPEVTALIAVIEKVPR